MRVEWLHLGWFCTHILRSVVDTDQTKQLISSLAAEVQTLQLELHRAHRLLDKYADTVEVDHWSFYVPHCHSWFAAWVLLGLQASIKTIATAETDNWGHRRF